MHIMNRTLLKKSRSSNLDPKKPHRATYEIPGELVMKIDQRIQEQPHYKLGRNAIVVEALLFYFAHRSEGTHAQPPSSKS